MSVEAEVLAEIGKLRVLLPEVSGSLVASLDGLLVADDTVGVEPEGVAALAAASLGLGQRFAATVRHGDLLETTISGVAGHVAVYAAGDRALLAVLATAAVNVDRMHLEARQVAERVTAIIEVLDVDSGDDLFDLEAHQMAVEPMPRRATA